MMKMRMYFSNLELKQYLLVLTALIYPHQNIFEDKKLCDDSVVK